MGGKVQETPKGSVTRIGVWGLEADISGVLCLVWVVGNISLLLIGAVPMRLSWYGSSCCIV